MKNKTIVALAGLAAISLNGIVFYAANAAGTPKSVSITSTVKTAKWNPTVKLTYGKTSIVMEPTGIPNHVRDKYYAVPISQDVVVPDSTTAKIVKDPTKAQSYKFTIPTTPK